MQFIGEVLGTWWTPWNKVTGEDIESPLPNNENLQDLADRLKNAVEHFCRDGNRHRRFPLRPAKQFS